jgi:hypothetical protein
MSLIRALLYSVWKKSFELLFHALGFCVIKSRATSDKLVWSESAVAD